MAVEESQVLPCSITVNVCRVHVWALVMSPDDLVPITCCTNNIPYIAMTSYSPASLHGRTFMIILKHVQNGNEVHKDEVDQ